MLRCCKDLPDGVSSGSGGDVDADQRLQSAKSRVGHQRLIAPNSLSSSFCRKQIGIPGTSGICPAVEMRRLGFKPHPPEKWLTHRTRKIIA